MHRLFFSVLILCCTCLIAAAEVIRKEAAQPSDEREAAEIEAFNALQLQAYLEEKREFMSVMAAHEATQKLREFGVKVLIREFPEPKDLDEQIMDNVATARKIQSSLVKALGTSGAKTHALEDETNAKVPYLLATIEIFGKSRKLSKLTMEMYERVTVPRIDTALTVSLWKRTRVIQINRKSWESTVTEELLSLADTIGENNVFDAD